MALIASLSSPIETDKTNSKKKVCFFFYVWVKLHITKIIIDNIFESMINNVIYLSI